MKYLIACHFIFFCYLLQSLCSWDPRKRPTAIDALQHPFFQSCFYVPPSVSGNVKIKNKKEQQYLTCINSSFIEFDSTRTTPTLSPSLHTKAAVAKTPPSAVVRGAVEQKCTKEAGYELSDETNVVARRRGILPESNFCRQLFRIQLGMINSCKALLTNNQNIDLPEGTFQAIQRTTIQPVVKPMKAGGWHGQHDLFHGRSKEFLPGRSFPRKVAG
ncbi:hypothetical protein KY289_034882 [Solanum tuberosum]|nr:hypothetical protein KY289_034882 [Solanum tuberosum]